ncbi:MAG: hypothetical protein ACRED4_02045 [Brevundimonas sp.]
MTERVLHARFRWAGGEHRFALPMAYHPGMSGFQRHGIEDPQARLKRLLLNENTVNDVFDVVRGGLIGGKAMPLGRDLDEFMLKHVVRRPLAEGTVLAKAILLVAIFGIPEGLADTVLHPADIVAEATDDTVTALDKAA